jgi:hypothetical protein
LGFVMTCGAMWSLRSYRHLYAGPGEEFTMPWLLHNIRSRITIVATDREWCAPHADPERRAAV